MKINLFNSGTPHSHPRVGHGVFSAPLNNVVFLRCDGPLSAGTAGVLVDMLFEFPHNNFLHAQVCALVRNARANRRFSHRYTAHLIEECNLLTRLMDAFEENEDKW
ncbi:jg25759 [Pararge aegeria aegeria]|uniref:Jg25759 protein n=1 Tax=Pararge aegeria aegeria TaxID=348720 RepID=A0A8S4R1A8_9NEOP|nr:jg25759 [Pararge aegeria aegeria]